MIQRLFLTAICSLFLLNLSAQGTIGSGEKPVRAALLDLKGQNPDSENITSSTGGLVLPRVKLTGRTTLDPFIDSGTDPEWKSADVNVVKKLKDDHTGLMVYNLSVSDPGETDENLIFEQGIYVWNGTQWNMHKAGETRSVAEKEFFYMPSFNLPLSGDPNLVLKFDLYEEYEKQFTQAGNSSFVSSDPSMTAIPKFGRDKLEYVVTAYDGTVIKEVKIDPSGATKGTLRYKCVSASAPASSFINIVFVILN